MERKFVAAGSLLLTGPDPTGGGHILPGFGDQREIELLVDSGFTPVEAISIGTLNAAIYLGRADPIGSIAIGKNPDLMVVKGDPSSRISDIENVRFAFRDGLGFNSQSCSSPSKAVTASTKRVYCASAKQVQINRRKTPNPEKS